MKLDNLLFALIIALFIPFAPLQATTISPFPNLGEMAKASDAVVLAKALRNFTAEEGANIRFRTSLQVIESIKGSLHPAQQFALQNYHLRIGDMERNIWGDLELKEGHTYLLFLNQIGNDLWQAQMLSYAAFEEHSREGKKVLVPFDLGTEVHFYRRPGQPRAEPLAVYSTKKLTTMLRNVVQAKQNWDKTEVATPYAPDSFDAGFRGVPPGHCTFLSSSPNIARWNNFETTSLPVRYHQDGDPGCATTAAEVAAAIGNINGSYLGVDLSSAGTHNYVPTCGMDGSNGGEFTTWVNTNLGGSRHLVIQFDDPCDEIADLVGCNGTLAFGGLYTFGSTHSSGGMTWQNTGYAYVVVNNGSGACQCGSTDYEIMLTHEMSHCLNIGHIAGSGTANMNPSCCNAISALDIECLDFIYVPAAVPVEVLSFEGQAQAKAIALEWISSSEANNDFYTLERRNKAGQFEALTQINGAGTSSFNQDYQYLDEQPNVGINYYRLSQTDFNGKTETVESIAVAYYDQMRVELSPNPLTGNILQTQIATDSKGSVLIEVYDLTGTRVLQQQEVLDKGENQLSLDLDQLSSGLYLLKATQNNTTQTIRFIKS